MSLARAAIARPLPRPGARRIGLLLAEAALLVVTGLHNLDNMNPDAIAYLRGAEHWLDGDPALAVTGYWGPLLGWLVVPSLALTGARQLSLQIAVGLSALLFTGAALRLYRVLDLDDAAWTVAALVTLPFAACWAMMAITPDLLMSGCLLLGLAALLEAAPRRAGAWLGLAYLAKAIALPAGVALVLLLALLRRLGGDRAAWRRTLPALGALAVVALPWILLLSLHEGRPTFATSGAINHAIVAPDNPRHGHPTFETLHRPAPGRLTSWEDPSGMPYARWSPWADAAALRWQLGLVAGNAAAIAGMLAGFDFLRIGLLACLVGPLQAGGWRAARWRLAGLPVAAMTGFYLPVYAGEARYFYGCFPLLLAAALGLAGGLARPGGWRRHAALGLVALSFLAAGRYQLPGLVEGFAKPAYRTAQALAPRLADLPGAIASADDDDFYGLYTAFVGCRPYFGNRFGATDLAGFVDSGAAILVIRRGGALDRALPDPLPAGVAPIATEPRWPIRVLRLPGAAGGAPPDPAPCRPLVPAALRPAGA